MKATRIKALPGLNNYSYEVVLFKVEPPIDGHDFVVSVEGGSPYFCRPETRLYPSNNNGALDPTKELSALHGKMSHTEVFRQIGYEVEPS